MTDSTDRSEEREDNAEGVERVVKPKADDGTGGLQGTRGGTDEDPTRPGDVGSGQFTDTDFDGDGTPDSRTDGRG